MNEDCLKLTCYFSERHRSGGKFVADRLLDIYGRSKIASSIMLRGVEGFGLKHHLRSDSSLTLSEDLPAVAIAVDSRQRIESILDEVAGIETVGLVTLERARLIQGDIGPLSLPEGLHEAAKLTVFLGRQERTYRVAAYVGVCELLHRRGIAGATVLLGVDGTRHGQRERAQFFGRNAEVPMMVMAIGTGDSIARVLPELGALLRNPLISLERVRICKRDGDLFERPHELPGTDPHGMALWQKLTIVTSAAAQHEGQPSYRAIIRQLRASGSSGATSLRGIWGFHGDHAPHGDRPLQVARHVPTLTIVIDTPERTAEAFPIIDALTSEHGLIISEMVPAVHARSSDHRRGGLRLASHHY